jgi:hypothetical protein
VEIEADVHKSIEVREMLAKESITRFAGCASCLKLCASLLCGTRRPISQSKALAIKSASMPEAENAG